MSEKPEIKFSDATLDAWVAVHLARNPQELRDTAKPAMESTMRDIIRHMMEPLAPGLMAALFVERLARL